jgi:hypothetical protein
VEIDVMTLIQPLGKIPDEKQHEKQQKVVAEKIAEIVAKQMLELVKVGPEEMTRQTIPSLQGRPGNELVESIMLLVRNDAWPIAEPAVAGAKVLAPTVTKFDAEGRATTELATVQNKKTVAIDSLPWAKWVELETPCPDDKLAKLMLETVVRQLHRLFMADPPPIAMMRTGKVIQMRTMEPIAKGKCVIPIFFRKANSMVMDGEQGGVRPRNGVHCSVDWTRRSVSNAEIEQFCELVDEVSVNVFIAPETKLPKGRVNEAVEWTMSEELHPFWFVKRAQADDKPNMELVFLSTSQILACDIKTLVEKGVKSVKPITEVAQIKYPVLVNTVDMRPDEELILRWSQLGVRGPTKSDKEKNAYDQLLAVQSRAKKARRTG